MVPTAQPAPDRARLHVVTGKGGTGKTTVAAALALALAGRGQGVLLVEVEDRQGISAVLDVPRLGPQEEQVSTDPSGGSVTALSVDAKAALMEYLQIFYRLGRAGSMLEKVGAVDFATTIAPGVRDVLVTGKIYEAVGRSSGGRSTTGRRRAGALVYDAVVVDAPPTGRVGRFLGVSTEVSDMAKVGPIRQQADAVAALMQSEHTLVHLVTLLEDMPVQETLDAAAELTRSGLHLGCVMVNQVVDTGVPTDLAAQLERDPEGVQERLAGDLTGLRVRSAATAATGVVAEARQQVSRAALQGRLMTTVRGLGQPVVQLPLVPEGLDAAGVRVLATRLDEQGVA